MFLIALVTVSCGAGGKTGEERTVVDLADDAQFARHQVETKAIDFGEEGSVKHLRDGWSHIEESAGNTRFRWAVGDSSGVRLNLSARRDLELTMTAKPHPLPQAAPQQVDVAFNGDSLATIEMQSRWSTYRLHVPATSQRLGENKLDFSYRYSRPLEESNGRADRRLAVAWERLAITDARVAVDEPATFGEPPRLFIPLGNRLEYFVALPEGSRLRISRVRARGGVNGEFVVDIAEDLREPLEIVISPDDSIDEPLLDGRSGVVRLALTAQPSALPEETQGFFLDEPLIVSPTSGATVSSPAERPSQRRPNVVVYLVDTLRTDALGVYD
ncbi:MAG: hypothetical protein OEM62_13050, partial [Acidobacteriota bacterium]|nr:hypothetical protein [Acidobacteriota bacterium]